MTSHCGSVRGYQDHVRDGSPKCAPCRRAHADKRAAYRRRRYLQHAPLSVDATGTRRRIHALAAVGYSLAEQSRRLGMEISGASAIARRTWVWVTTAEKVRALYDELSMVPGNNNRARNEAKRRGWPPPLAWDDETIDDPRARPVLGSALDRRAGVVPDEIAIQSAMRGYRVGLRPVERAEAVHRLTAAGHPAAEIAHRLRIEERSVQRIRDAHRTQGEAS